MVRDGELHHPDYEHLIGVDLVVCRQEGGAQLFGLRQIIPAERVHNAVTRFRSTVIHQLHLVFLGCEQVVDLVRAQNPGEQGCGDGETKTQAVEAVAGCGFHSLCWRGVVTRNCDLYGVMATSNPASLANIASAVWW